MLDERDNERDAVIDDAIHAAKDTINVGHQSDLFLYTLRKYGYDIVKRSDDNAED